MAEKDTLYARWLENNISESELRELEKSGELEELKAIIEQTDALATPDYNKDEAYRELRKSIDSKVSVKRLWMRYSGIAASILLVASAYFFLRDTSQTIQSEYGNVKEYAFFESSKVKLNDGSSIEFNTKKWDESREVELKGEAFFEVSKGVPFIVSTEYGNIEVLGTSFNIRSWDGTFAVECYSGKVRVTRNGQEIILTAKEETRMVKGQLSEKETFEQTKPYWTQNSSKFSNEKVTSVFREVERQYDVEIQVPSLDQYFTGSFTHDNITEAMSQICVPLGLNYTISEDGKKLEISK